MLLQDFNWKAEVLRSSEPVLVDFWAPWCGPCRTLNPVIEVVARDHKVCKVNVDKNQALAGHYQVASIPTLMIFHGGRVVRGSWVKDGLDAPVELRSGGRSLELPPGRTWIELVPVDGGNVTVTR